MKKVVYLSDGADWVIKEIGKSLSRELADKPFECCEKVSPFFRGIKHYSTRYRVSRMMFRNPLTKNILTFYHGTDEDTVLIDKLRRYQKNIDIIHTSCEITKNFLIKHGIEKDRIKIVPIGIDVKFFSRFNQNEKNKLRETYGIPQDAFVIGSFQKDGNGWGEGLTPKLIKGPDLFCDAVEKIHQKNPIFVFLTGPARGYVKKRLDDAGIPYKHVFLEDYQEVIKCFNALDLYLATPRTEGGPRSPMECQASGVPIICSRVGQAPAVIEDGVNGFLTEVGDTDRVVKHTLEIMDNKKLAESLIENGLKSVVKFDYASIAKLYWDELYLPLM